MNEEQAIDALKFNRPFAYTELQEAVDVAIKALEEVQAYRAIGLTPELIEAMQGHNIAMINDLEEYQRIGTVEELQALKEKDTPKKPIIKEWCPARCPACGYALSESQGDGYYSHPTFLERCPIVDCGHKLDWS